MSSPYDLLYLNIMARHTLSRNGVIRDLRSKQTHATLIQETQAAAGFRVWGLGFRA